MCGNHHPDGSPVAHHHHGPVFHPRLAPRRYRRRAFLGDLGKGTVAVAVFAPAVLAACGDDGDRGAGSAGDTTVTSTTAAPTTSGPSTTPTTSQPGRADGEPVAPLRWARTDHGFVSSYVLVRGTEAAIVDTGAPGSADDIGRTLSGMGLTYADVRHVVLTHHHPDHVGSIDDVLARAGGATAHAGDRDLDEIARDRINPLRGGEEIFGLEVLATPGHTEGHVSVIDHATGILVAGDALNTFDGGVQGPNPDFTADMATANESVRRLAELSFNTLLAGHGDPVEQMADTAVADLAAAL